MSLLHYHSPKASILWFSAFFTVQLSHPYMTTRRTIALTRQIFVSKVMSLLFNMLSIRDSGQEEKGMTEDEMAGWHHWVDGRESEWTPGVGDGQGGLACCNSWGHKELNTTEWLKWTELMLVIAFLPRSKHLLISWPQSPSAVILAPLQKINLSLFSLFPPSIFHEVVGLDSMIFIFWMLSFKPVFFTLLFHFHQ